MTEARTARRPARRVHARRAALVAVALVLLAAAATTSWLLWGRGGAPLPQPGASVGAGVRPRYLGSFGDTGSPRLIAPLGIAIAGERVYVADAGAHTVAVFDRAGTRVATLSGGGMEVPAYVAVDPRDGRVLVSDRQAGTLLAFGADGHAKGAFDPKLPQGIAATGTAGPWRPLAAAFAPDGTLYVTDVAGEHRVLVFAPDGAFRRVLTGPPDHGLSYPNGIAVLGRDVVVADSNNARLIVFASDGSVALQIRTGGLPRGVAVVASGTGAGSLSDLVVADTIGRKLTLWASDGTSLGEAGHAGSGTGEFAYPTDVAAGSDGTVYATDTGNRRVQMWSMGPPTTGGAKPAFPLATTRWSLPSALVTGALLLVAGLAAAAVTAARRRLRRSGSNVTARRGNTGPERRKVP